jgi:hypothetical protein
MKATFNKQNFNETAVSKQDYIDKFNALGFSPTKVEICFTNGCSAYISINVNVLNENEMYADVFVYEGKASLQVRVSDHISNLEKICGGVSGNKMSFNAFKSLVSNKVIN